MYSSQCGSTQRNCLLLALFSPRQLPSIHMLSDGKIRPATSAWKFTFQKGQQQLHSHVGYKTKYHLLLVQHSDTTNMEAEVHIQNRLKDPPPDYLLRRQQQLFQQGIRHIDKFTSTHISLMSQHEELRNKVEVAGTDPLMLKLSRFIIRDVLIVQDKQSTDYRISACPATYRDKKTQFPLPLSFFGRSKHIS